MDNPFEETATQSLLIRETCLIVLSESFGTQPSKTHWMTPLLDAEPMLPVRHLIRFELKALSV